MRYVKRNSRIVGAKRVGARRATRLDQIPKGLGAHVSKDPELEMWKKVGSPGWTRTSDILINSQALYRLSYRGVSVAEVPDNNRF